MSPEIDTPIILASSLILCVLIASALLWYLGSRKSQQSLYPQNDVPAWSIGWVNFGIFICALVTAVVVAQQIAFTLFSDTIEASEDSLTPEIAVIGVLMLQIPLLTVFYLARRFYPAYYAGRLNANSLSTLRALKIALVSFIKYLPAIWLVSLIWGQLLNLLQKQGLIDAFPPQEIITLFSEGGNPLPIGFLAFAAIILAPLVEELIFRGCIYRFLKSQMVQPIAMLASALFFALIHLNLMSFVPLMLVGILLVRIYEETGNIKAAICFHAFFNGFNLLLLFILSQSNVTI